MKRLLSLMIAATLTLIITRAQDTPNGINYQAVARDNLGKELPYKSLNVKFSISQNSPTGTLEWEEMQKTTTNQFGLFTLILGQSNNRTSGTAVNFDSIKWGSGAHYLKVEVDFEGNGDTYVSMGTTQMLAVPYALYAKTAGNGGGNTSQITYNPDTRKLYANGKEIADFSSIGANAVQNINLNGNLLTYTQNGQDHTIDFSKYLDNTDSQNLSLNGRTLSISNGNSVTLPDTVVQNLSLNNRILSISKGNSVTLPDQVQDLTWANDTVLQITNNPNASRINLRKFLNNQLTTGRNQLTISNGNTVIVNTDTTKQDLTILKDTLTITKNSSATKIGLSKYLDNTDNQTLSLVGNSLTISTGNTIDVSNLVNVPWEGFSYNNNSGVGIPGGQELQIAWNKEFDDGNLIQNNSLVSTSNSAVYSISFYLNLYNSSNTKVKFYKGLNEYKTFDVYNNSITLSFLVKLNQGETISIKVQNTGSFSNNLVSAIFSGYRVH